MEPIYRIDPNLDVPIYQQLVDAIQAAIKKGTLTAGQKLPTVQELSQGLSIARGTIKRAYDELEHRGLVEKVQGRGTFVSYKPLDSASRKEQAMASIDAMLDELEEMGFSPAQINIFLNLKLRDRAQQDAMVKVALVENSPEYLNQMCEQLGRIEGVEVYSFLLDAVRQYPYKLGEDFELVVTTAAHGEYIQSILPPKKRVCCVALRPGRAGLWTLLRLPAGVQIGVVGYSRDFAESTRKSCMTCTEGAAVAQPLSLELPDADLAGYLADKDVLVVPAGCERYFSAQDAALVQSFRGQVVEFFCEMDEGSLLYLETKIKRLIDAKSL